MSIRWLRGRWRAVCGPAGDRGWVTFWVIPIMVGLIAMTGLVVDGGRALAARERAADIAQQSARAGADDLDVDALRNDPDTLELASGAADVAKQEAQQECTTSGITCDVSASSTDVSVTVSITIHEPTEILSLAHLDSISGSASATATAVRSDI